MSEEINKNVFESFQELKQLSTVKTGIDLERARQLAYLKKDGNYKIIMGDQEASWTAFIAQPELQLSKSTAERLVKIYQVYVEKYGLKEEDLRGIDSNSLYRLSTVVNDDTIEEWISKAKNLSRADIYKEVKFGDIDEMQCSHFWTNKTLKTCTLCGAKEYEKNEEV